MGFEITIPDLPIVQLEVVEPDKEYNLVVEQPPVVQLDVNTAMSIESNIDFTLLFQISIL